MKTYLSLLLFFWCTIFSCTAQQGSIFIDSLLKVYKTQKNDSNKVKTLGYLFNAYQNNEVGKSKKYADEALKLAHEINYKSGIAEAMHNLGSYNYYLGEIDSAKSYFDKSLNVFTELQDLRGQAKVNMGLGALLYSNGKYEEALEVFETNVQLYKGAFTDSLNLGTCYKNIGEIHNDKGNHRIALTNCIKSLHILENLKDPAYIAITPLYLADTKNLLAAIEFKLGNFQKAIQYDLEALKTYEEKHDKHFSAIALIDIGASYHELKEYKKAIGYFDKALLLTKEINSFALQAVVLQSLGKSYREMNQFKKAESLFKESLFWVEKSNVKRGIFQNLVELGITYNSMGQSSLAIPFFNKAIIGADSTGAKPILRKAYLNRSKAYQSLDNFELALKDFQNYKSISDSIFNTTKLEQVEELKTIYETEKKEQQITLQEKEITVLEQKAEISSLQRLLLALGLGLSLLIFGLGYYALRQKIKRNKLEKEKLDTELAFKKKELTTHALHLAKKNEVLEGLKQKAETLKNSENNQNGYQQLIRTINFDLKDDNNWEHFSKYFQEVHKDFNSTVKQKFPEVTTKELRLIALLKMNLSSKEIANILNISMPGVKKARQRLRKKMQLSTHESLEDTILAI